MRGHFVSVFVRHVNDAAISAGYCNLQKNRIFFVIEDSPVFVVYVCRIYKSVCSVHCIECGPSHSVVCRFCNTSTYHSKEKYIIPNVVYKICTYNVNKSLTASFERDNRKLEYSKNGLQLPLRSFKCFEWLLLRIHSGLQTSQNDLILASIPS